jgi:hypothetical protein
MAAISLTYTLTNGTTADASQVMQNLNDIVNGTSDATKDFSISALTCAGTATFNGAVTLGNATADDITITGSLASSIPIKTTNSYDIGSADLGLAGIYFGTADTDTVRVVAAAQAADRTYTMPDAGAAASFVMTAGTQTLTGATTLSAATTLSGGWVTGASGTANSTGDANKGTISSVSFTKFYRGTFTLTVTGGVTATVDVTCYYEQVGNIVTLHIPDAYATSNATTQAYLTSIPSTLRPARNQNFLLRIVDNSVNVHGFAQVATNGDINLFNTIVGGSTFTSSNLKGLSACTFTYTLN